MFPFFRVFLAISQDNLLGLKKDLPTEEKIPTH